MQEQVEWAKGKAGYLDTLLTTHSKNADPDIPVVKQAKAEYAGLK